MTHRCEQCPLNPLARGVCDKLVVRSGYGVGDSGALALWPAIADALRQMQASLNAGSFTRASEAKQHVRAGTGRRDCRGAHAGHWLKSWSGMPRACRCGCCRSLRGSARAARRGPFDLAVGFFPLVLADLAVQTSPRHGAFRSPAAVAGEYVCVMRKDTLWRRTADDQALLRGAPLAGELFRRSFGFVDESLARSAARGGSCSPSTSSVRPAECGGRTC